MLYFNTGDHATDHNLQRLSHLASLDRFDDDPEQMHSWLIAVIDSVRALPKVAATHFKGHYFLGDTHFRMQADRRIEMWRKLVGELWEHVAAAHADPILKRDCPNGPPDMSDRGETRGEQIIALSEQLEKASWGTREFNGILARIEAIAVGDVRSDVAELKRLSARKRIPNVGEHRYRIYRHISHMRLVADQLHHLD
jgi:hypothetical protein